jgi:hypothetical protein
MMSARVARSGLRAAQQLSVARPAFSGLRTYATPAQSVRPPVALFGVDGTYATALVCIRPSANLFVGNVEVFCRPRVAPTPPAGAGLGLSPSCISTSEMKPARRQRNT